MAEGRTGVVLLCSRTIVCIFDFRLAIAAHGKCVVAGHTALHEDDQGHEKGEGFHGAKIGQVMKMDRQKLAMMLQSVTKAGLTAQKPYGAGLFRLVLMFHNYYYIIE